MGVSIYKDKTIKTEEEYSQEAMERIGYLHTFSMELDFKRYNINNLHNDIIIKDKGNIYLKIPFVDHKKKIMVKAILKPNECIIGYEEKGFIDFIQGKMNFSDTIESNMLILYLLEYFSLKYTEDLLQMEDRMDELFQEYVDEEVTDTKEILKLKREASLIKRYTTYYKSILSYLYNEFKGIKIYNRVQFIINNTVSLVDNVEGSIYACVDIYNSVQSNKMNKTMQLLTTITVLSLPFTIVSGIFGMNFESMPLIENNLGFIIIALITILIIIFEIIFFKKKNFFK